MGEFEDRVYAIVKNIPKGCVMNYGMVAMLAGYPKRARHVGRALHNNPDPSTIPCHRVVMRDGSLTPAFAFGGEGEHRRRLEAEGVTFKGDKVDMALHVADISLFFE